MEGFGEKLNQYKLAIALSLVGVVLIIGGIYSSGVVSYTSSSLGKTASEIKQPFPKESLSAPKVEEIKVDLSGAVINPGVYALPKDSRVEDLIKFAGGFSSSASAEYIAKGLNLSQKISDGQKIYIPFTGENFTLSVGSTALGSVAGAETQGKIGLNSGTMEGLDKLPGVGPVTAGKIIQNRPYQTVSELLSKKVVSKAVYDKIKDLVDIN